MELDRGLRRREHRRLGGKRTFEGAPSDPRSHPTRVQVTGYASARGNERDNRALAQRRADAVVACLAAHGWTNVATRVTTSSAGETGADPSNPDNPLDRRVDLIVDNNDRQVVINHEFGHAFGLDDEHAVADTAGNAGWVNGTGGNAGSTVNEWNLGAPPTSRSAVESAITGVHGPGDFPTPSGDQRFA